MRRGNPVNCVRRKWATFLSFPCTLGGNNMKMTGDERCNGNGGSVTMENNWLMAVWLICYGGAAPLGGRNYKPLVVTSYLWPTQWMTDGRTVQAAGIFHWRNEWNVSGMWLERRSSCLRVSSAGVGWRPAFLSAAGGPAVKRTEGANDFSTDRLQHVRLEAESWAAADRPSPMSDDGLEPLTISSLSLSEILQSETGPARRSPLNSHQKHVLWLWKVGGDGLTPPRLTRLVRQTQKHKNALRRHFSSGQKGGKPVQIFFDSSDSCGSQTPLDTFEWPASPPSVDESYLYFRMAASTGWTGAVSTNESKSWPFIEFSFLLVAVEKK